MATLRNVIILIFIAIICGAGCSETQNGGNVNPSTNNRLLERESGALSAEFYLPDNPDFGNYSGPSGIYNMGYKFLPALTIPITFYKSIHGEWPSSWKQVKEYMPLLPIDYATGLPYELGDYREYNGIAPANVIMAAWSKDGPEIFVANPTKDGFACAEYGKTEFLNMLNMLDLGSPGIDEGKGFIPSNPQFRLASYMLSVSSTILSDYSFRHHKLPASTSEFLECFIVNPDFNPGYTRDLDNNFGTFKVLVDLKNNQSLFNYTIGPPKAHMSYPAKYGSISEGGGIKGHPYNAECGEYITVFTEDPFFD